MTSLLFVCDCLWLFVKKILLKEKYREDTYLTCDGIILDFMTATAIKQTTSLSKDHQKTIPNIITTTTTTTFTIR
jgi:hypothetical protein